MEIEMEIEIIEGSLLGLVESCKSTNDDNNLLHSVMDGFDAINRNGQAIRDAISAKSEGGILITSTEIQLIESSYAEAIRKLFTTLDLVTSTCIGVNRDKIIRSISANIVSRYDGF